MAVSVKSMNELIAGGEEVCSNPDFAPFIEQMKKATAHYSPEVNADDWEYGVAYGFFWACIDHISGQQTQEWKPNLTKKSFEKAMKFLHMIIDHNAQNDTLLMFKSSFIITSSVLKDAAVSSGMTLDQINASLNAAAPKGFK